MVATIIVSQKALEMIIKINIYLVSKLLIKTFINTILQKV